MKQLVKRRRRPEEDEQALAIIAISLGGGPTHIRTLRTYLTRSDLAGHPRFSSAWAHMRGVGNDRAFVTTMGVDVRTFEALLTHFSQAWDNTTITRSDVNSHGAPRLHKRSLDAAGGLGLLLHWLSSTMAGHSLHQIFAITPAVCARCLQHARSILLTVLKDLQIARISWPSREDQVRSYSDLIEGKFPLLTNCFGFIDGLNLPVMVADDEEIQNVYYNGWTCSHYCSNILTFAPDGSIIHVILNAPGSWHDSNIASQLYHKLLHDTPEGYRVINDTAFPRVTKRLDYQIVAPSKRGDRLPTNPVDFTQLKLFNDELVSARQAAEWGMRSIQGSFSRLKLPLPAADHEYRAEVIELAVRLHQVKCQSVGINQTQTVYQTVESENRILARTFHRMLFSQIQRTCRISRYYHGWL
ncbi:hypothetical protein MJO29_010305 [Puccinia striiformis f. sp. tritici]|nr:hypothetical protein MJO29_010305 [Puccinia striiformis f. sp. tritici]